MTADHTPPDAAGTPMDDRSRLPLRGRAGHAEPSMVMVRRGPRHDVRRRPRPYRNGSSRADGSATAARGGALRRCAAPRYRKWSARASGFRNDARGVDAIAR
jgi:hypothetical protein